MLKRKKCPAQTTLEYAVLITALVGAILAIQIYMKRGVEGKLRESTDTIGSQFDAENTKVSRTTNTTGTTVQTVTAAGETKSETGTGASTAANVQSESGTETVAAWETEE